MSSIITGTAFSIGVLSHMLKIDDALVGAISCMSKVLAEFIYAFAPNEFVFYMGKFMNRVLKLIIFFFKNELSFWNYSEGRYF